MPDVEALQNNVQGVLDSMRSFVETASDLPWNPSDGFLPIVRRAILRRQFDSLEAISHLVAEKKGYAAGPLLRPACEELIWIKYLAGIGHDDSEELLKCVATRELLDSLRAQDKYSGRAVTTQLGLLSSLEDAVARKDAMRARLLLLGTRLDWPCDTIEAGELPSVFWFAKKTGQKKVYEFLYHATSRLVHFSAAELLRRAWGKPGSVSVRSIHFRDYLGCIRSLLGSPPVPRFGNRALRDPQHARRKTERGRAALGCRTNRGIQPSANHYGGGAGMARVRCEVVSTPPNRAMYLTVRFAARR